MNNFTIQGRLIGLNEYTKSSRTNKYKSAQVKRKEEEYIGLFIRKAKLKKVDKPIILHIKWYEENNRRDIDNITFAVKFILDELVNEGILIDDSRKYVKSINHNVYTDKENPRIEVELIEREKNE